MERVKLARLLGSAPTSGNSPIVINASTPEAFMAAFGPAVARQGAVFLADPAWGAREYAQLERAREQRADSLDLGWLCLPTGGSAGAVKFARHDGATVAAAVAGFADYFEVKRVNAVGVLPLHHVSGLMAWLRCVLTGGRYQPWSSRDLEQERWPALASGDWFLSLVPTQLERLLTRPRACAWLRTFRAVFIGGAPAWPQLVERAADERLPLAFSYGATETAAMVTALRPEQFLAGQRGAGHSLPHAKVSLSAEGRVQIDAASLFRGYWPEQRSGPWEPGDLARFDRDGGLHLEGRADALIITGGEKVNPSEVEAALRETGAFSDVAVIGVPDAEWGTVVVAAFPAGDAINAESVDHALRSVLAGFKRPKRYVPVPEWPRNAQGKVSRTQLADQVKQLLGQA